jgi:polysaccharide biosynthesis protein PslG
MPKLLRLCALVLLILPKIALSQSALPTGPLPAGLGANIHFTHAAPREIKLLADSGMTWIRMDFFWAGIEKSPGKYDFSHYDELMTDLDANHIHALFILDYGNPLYEKDSPSTDDAREAFAKFAAAAVTHFAGRGIVWEMWNEPNGGFWKPKANVDNYAKLALITGKVIHQAQPGETYIGPGTSGVDLKFCEGCFKAGCLADWAAVSVHPYRQGGPESVLKDYQKLNDLIVKYGPAGKTIPILSGEWGWSAAWKNFTPQRQADYLARQWLINQWLHVPISIYYDWHDDGTNPKEPEHHFGMLDHDYKPKPAYVAATTLISQLRGFTFDRRIVTDDPKTYVLAFKNDKLERYAVWTSSDKPAEVQFKIAAGNYDVFSESGEKTSSVQVSDGTIKLSVDGSPRYVVLR